MAGSRPLTTDDVSLPDDTSATAIVATTLPLVSTTLNVMFCTEPPFRPDVGTVVVTLMVSGLITDTIGASDGSGSVVATRLVYTESLSDVGTNTGLASGSQHSHWCVVRDHMKMAAHTLLLPTARAHSATVVVVPRSAKTALHRDPDATSVLLVQTVSIHVVAVVTGDTAQPNWVHSSTETE